MVSYQNSIVLASVTLKLTYAQFVCDVFKKNVI